MVTAVNSLHLRVEAYSRNIETVSHASGYKINTNHQLNYHGEAILKKNTNSDSAMQIQARLEHYNCRV